MGYRRTRGDKKNMGFQTQIQAQGKRKNHSLEEYIYFDEYEKKWKAK